MKKSLSGTNPYLQNPILKEKMIRDFIVSSSAIEGIRVKYDDVTKQFVVYDKKRKK